MKKTLFWLGLGGCGGDTISALNAAEPDFTETLHECGIDILWHPSMSAVSFDELKQMTDDIITGNKNLDFLVVEGAVIRGPGGTGNYDLMFGKPKKDLLAKLAGRAQHVIALGTCASFGGIASKGEVEGTGLQYHEWEKGGFLGKNYVSGSGRPVINLPGCPAHPEVFTGTLLALSNDKTLHLGNHNTPDEWYGTLIHQGCTRNEYHEYRVEEEGFGEPGCLFFHLGCHGPLAYGPCNKLIWNRHSTKTRVGVPCFGCTRPDFPQPYPFFRTRNIEGIPLELPDGVDRAHYMAYKGLAAAAAPGRLIMRTTKV